MDFPIHHLMDEQACYDWLVRVLHPRGLSCPRCGRSDRLGVHRRQREPVLDYQCGHWRCVFNAFTGTDLHHARRRPSQLVLILRGVSQGQTTARLARELRASRGQLLEFRHRPPVFGIVGRSSHELHLDVARSNAITELRPLVLAGSRTGSTINSDDCLAYRCLPEYGRQHQMVKHNARPREFARDDDGDGIREVHNNTSEGTWTGLRNFLRPFRGVNKCYLQQYVAVFEWGYNLKRVNDGFLRILLGTSTAEGP